MLMLMLMLLLLLLKECEIQQQIFQKITPSSISMNNLWQSNRQQNASLSFSTYTNTNTNNNNNKCIFVLMANNRLEYHHSDGSMLQYKDNQVLYISKKGIKSVLASQEVQKSGQLLSKWVSVVQKFNRYSEQHCYVTQAYDRNKTNQGADKYDELEVLGIKIREFCWKNPQIEQTASGDYQVYSDCRHASVTLRQDLYIVQVQYMQLVDSQHSYVRTPNMTKLLLQKYNHSYSQFPALTSTSTQNQQPKYYYIKHTKIYSIFNVARPWRYPLHLIWASLLQYQVVQHRFCYVEYEERDMDGDRTSMPQCYSRLQQVPTQSPNDKKHPNNSKTVLPIIGKINHDDRCLVIEMGDVIGWTHTTNNNIMPDAYGFWSVAGNLASYRTVNKPKADQQYYLKAIPRVIRFDKEPQRSIQQQLKLFAAYIYENQQLQSRTKSTMHEDSQDRFDNGNALVCEHDEPSVGLFKAYSNGSIVVSFVDRTLITLNSKKMEAKVLSSNGSNCYVDLSSSSGVNYQNNRAYIHPAVEFMERVFYPQQWAEKQEYSQQIEQVMQITSVLQKASSTYLKL